MLDTTSFDAFKASALAAGFDEALLRQWPAGATLDTHTHDFAVEAVVMQGEMWLTHRGQTRRLVAGDRFEVPPGDPHAERYGAEGTALWVARRRASGPPAAAPRPGAPC